MLEASSKYRSVYSHTLIRGYNSPTGSRTVHLQQAHPCDYVGVFHGLDRLSALKVSLQKRTMEWWTRQKGRSGTLKCPLPKAKNLLANLVRLPSTHRPTPCTYSCGDSEPFVSQLPVVLTWFTTNCSRTECFSKQHASKDACQVRHRTERPARLHAMPWSPHRSTLC